MKFTWKNNDVDIAVEFAGNHLTSIGANNSTYDKIPVGYSMHNHNKGKAPEVIGMLVVPVRGGCLLSIGDKPFYSGVVMRQEDKVKQFSLMLRYWKGMSILPGKSNLMFMPHGILPIGLQIQ